MCACSSSGYIKSTDEHPLSLSLVGNFIMNLLTLSLSSCLCVCVYFYFIFLALISDVCCVYTHNKHEVLLPPSSSPLVLHFCWKGWNWKAERKWHRKTGLAGFWNDIISQFFFFTPYFFREGYRLSFPVDRELLMAMHQRIYRIFLCDSPLGDSCLMQESFAFNFFFFLASKNGLIGNVT